MAKVAGNSSRVTSISRQSSQAIAASAPSTTMLLLRMTNSACTYSALTDSVSLVTRLTSWPVMALSKKAIGSRITWPYTRSRSRSTARIATPAKRTSCR